MESILTSIKKLLGITEEYDHFDADIVMYINTALAILTQLGIGPESGFSIRDKASVWTDFIPDDPRLESIKSYIYLKVKLLFDPPLSASAIESIKNLTSELEWRLNVTVDPKETVGKEGV